MSLEAKAVVKDFGGIRAVAGVSFTVPEGTITGLIGPNGSGKTTFFNLVTGFLPIDEGEIWYRGRRIDGFKPLAAALPPAAPLCDNGLDDDGDGAVDLYDRHCKSAADNDESRP